MIISEKANEIDFDILGEMFYDIISRAEAFSIWYENDVIKALLRYKKHTRPIKDDSGNIMALLFRVLEAMEELDAKY